MSTPDLAPLQATPSAAAAPSALFGHAEGYEAMMGRWSARLAPLFLGFAGAADGQRVLDVGCGTGALLQALAETRLEADLSGVDTDAGFLAFADQRLAGRGVQLQCGDAHALPWPDASFDQSLSLLVLMALDDPARAAAEMRRVTRPGGRVAACTWLHEGLAMSQVLWEEATRLDPAAETRIRRFRHANRPGQLTALWRATGLVEVVETSLNLATPFAGFDDFWAPLSGVGPGGVYVRSLAEGPRAELRDALRARLLDCGGDRPFELSATALAVSGRVPG